MSCTTRSAGEPLNWLGYKAIYYSLAAKYFHADTFLHPIRHSYQINWMSKTGIYGYDFTAKLIQSFSRNLSTLLPEVIDNGMNTAIPLELPFFSAWLTEKTGDVRELISAAQQIREEQPFHDIRGHLKAIRVAYDEHDLSSANKLVNNWKEQV